VLFDLGTDRQQIFPLVSTSPLLPIRGESFSYKRVETVHDSSAWAGIFFLRTASPELIDRGLEKDRRPVLY